MDALEQLETVVSDLLVRVAALKQENMRLQKNLEVLGMEKTVLAAEKNDLHVMLEQERSLRQDALLRVDSLLRKIEEHGSIG